jgi:hypothetical protein
VADTAADMLARGGALNKSVEDIFMAKTALSRWLGIPAAAGIGLFAMANTQPVDAQASYSRNVRINCTADSRRLCPAYKLGSNEMRVCMEAKARLLSRQCVRALEDEGLVPRGMLRGR